MKRMRAATALLAASLALAACDQERAPLPGAEPTGDAAISSPAPPSGGPAPATDGSAGGSGTEASGALPLKLEGIGSKAELDRALAKLDDAEARTQFEMGFRNCFVADRGRRDYGAAAVAMDNVLQREPGFAPAYRVIAYTKLNTGFDMAGATTDYEKAVELDPDYGEAHYALSFMLTQFDVERGRTHFQRAMELGVPDERDLGSRFYP